MRRRLSAVSLLAAATLLTAGSAVAAEGDHVFSANVALVSDYVFRGITQSNEEPTVQGGFDYEYAPLGLYAGIWGSGVDFTDASTELDYYAGWRHSWDKLSFDVGAIYYDYPGSDGSLEYDFWEASAALGYDFDVAAATIAVNYSPEYFGDSGDATYSAFYLDIPLPYSLTLNSHIGYQAIDDNDTFGTPDYADWGVGLGYNLAGFDLAVTYTDTDLSKSECADGCDERVIFSVSRSF
jgi:uncharacterized protein (TIGR02001 family)